MKRNAVVRFGSMALAAAVLITGSWYVDRETDDLSIPQIVEYIDTEDGSIVIPEEEVPLATKPTVKVKRTTKKKVKKSKLKKKAKKTAKTTKRTKKSKTVKKENAKQKVATDTTVLTTVVSATKKDSNVKTVTTTVQTTVKTTTTNKPKGSSGEAAASANTATTNTAAASAQATASADQLQTVSDVTVRAMAPKADANVLSAFENLEFKIEINPTSSYSGYFSVKAHNIILKKSGGDTIYHELGHFVGWLAGNVDTSSEFVAIYNQEKGALQSANYQYLTKSSAEYFAESYKDYVLSPQNLQSTRPQTYDFVKKAVSRITDARVTNIKSAYMKAYWS